MPDRERVMTPRSLALRLVRCAAPVAVALVLAACNGGGGAPAADESDPPPTQSPGAPAAEGSGPEQPAPDAPRGPAIQTAGLPIGGNTFDALEQRQCVPVSWLGTDLPSGVAVRVTRVWTSKPERFSVSDFDCSGEPCGSYTFDSDSDSCTVAVTVTATTDDDADLFMEGRVSCSSGDSGSCRDLVAGLERQPAQLSYRPESPTDTEASPTPSEPDSD